MMVSVTMSPLSTSDARRLFESLDRNNDGILSLNELTRLLEQTGVCAHENDDLALIVGEDGLTFDDFCSLILGSDHNNNYKIMEDEDMELLKAFKVFDLNGDGLISSKELQSVLWKLGMWDKYGGLDCDSIMLKYDVNSDGFVDFSEFKLMMLAH